MSVLIHDAQLFVYIKIQIIKIGIITNIDFRDDDDFCHRQTEIIKK